MLAQPRSDGSCDDDEVGPECIRGLLKGVDRRVRTKVGDAPAVVAQGEPERDQGQVMMLARRAREESAPPATSIPAARESEHPATQEVAREVLLRDRDLSPLPALTESA